MLYFDGVKYGAPLYRGVMRCRLAGAMLVLSLAVSCSPQKALEADRELLVYCGITMIKPISEIARQIETA